MKKIKLKPCPFCGGQPNSGNLFCDGTSPTQFEPICWIECCGFSNHSSYKDRGKLMEAWNRRVGDEQSSDD
jgi:hypothetical protein